MHSRGSFLIHALLAATVLAACEDKVTPVDDPPWVVVREGQPAALLSIWGVNERDVYAVGGDARDGNGPAMLHFDGTEWTRIDAAERNTDLWAVFGFEGGPIFVAGSKGTILRYQNGVFEKFQTPESKIVFGLFGTSPNDMWAVGGNYNAGGFVWHFDGNAWSVVPGVPEDIATQGTIWKVSGRSSSDVWMTGTMGALLHWNGSALERVTIPFDGSLFSVGAANDRYIAVGGSFNGVIYENAGDGWTSALPEGGSLLSGVATLGTDAYAVGHFGMVLRRKASGWAVDGPSITTENLHSAWIDPTGGVWVVGGDFDAQPTTDGVLIRKEGIAR